MTGLEKTFLWGLALAIPLAIVGHVFYHVLHIIEKLISPVTVKLGIHSA